MIERAIILSESDQLGFEEFPFLDESDQLVEEIPKTNLELKQIKKEIRQKATHKIEKNFVLDALMRNKWDVTQAAKEVGMQRTNFQNLMKKHFIKRPPVPNQMQ